MSLTNGVTMIARRKNLGCRSLACSLLALMIAVCPVRQATGQTGSRVEWRESLGPNLKKTVEKFRAEVPSLIDEGGIRGVAIALVDHQGVIWAEGFGRADLKKRIPVTPHTPFPIGGISQLLTALGVMRAVESDVVDLDEPIKTYVPKFMVHSRYEENPESGITLRRLLSYTSGLPGAAPLGNFFEPSPGIPFEDHVESLLGVWLICPVGEAVVYSRPNYDLAAYVLQTVAKESIDEQMKELVFKPLQMTNTTVNRAEILLRRDRAEGHQFGAKELPAVNPFLGSGCAYSTATDLAHLLAMLMNDGVARGERFLEQDTVELMQKPVGRMAPGEGHKYRGLGIMIDKRAPEFTEPIHYSEGWGFGINSFLHWYPEYGIGVVCLSNEGANSAFGRLALGLTDQLIGEGIVEKRYPQPQPEVADCVPKWSAWAEHEATPYKEEWGEFTGLYPLRFDYKLQWWAQLAAVILGKDEWTPRIRIHEKDGFLYVTESTFFTKIISGLWPRHVEEPLQELKPGVFMSCKGWLLDFRGEVPRWGNYRLKD
jgi:CubicO group peptidase (beta-lactamase class C family)